MGAYGILFAAVLSTMSPMQEPSGQQPHEQAPAGHAMTHPGILGPYAMTREASGTAWQPESSPMHGLQWQRGGWSLMAHGAMAVGYMNESGPRGDSAGFGTGMVMGAAQRRFGSRTVTFRGMATLEPVIGASGYPLLLQNGETADGINPLIDRQHPHDSVMELSATFSQAPGENRSVFLYVAPVGEPAIGPAAFMHRGSAADLPFAPISHHWLDSTHITHGVITAGFTTPEGFKAEASVFNGREPDQDRWGIQTPSLNSYSGRITLNPTADLSVQFSGARLDSPAQFHGDLDAIRMTASATYNRPLRAGNVQATAAWGRSKRLLPDGTEIIRFEHDDHVHVHELDIVDNSLVQDALLFEGIANLSDHTLMLRFEHANKDELFPTTDVRHADVFGVSRVTLGYVFDLPTPGPARYGVGLTGSLALVPTELRPDYGSSPTGFSTFLRMRLGR